MRFVDHCKIRVVAGDGGNGSAAFRREKFVPFGGPSGGDGGKGGDVILEAAEGLSSLQDVVYQRTISADRGEHGQGSDCYGRGGEDRLVRVPAGTQVFDEDTESLVADLTQNGQRFVVARGGRGGRGNKHFATPQDRAPRRAEKGEQGEAKNLRLELKVMADVGLLGFPNVGKSTFVSAVSKARPRIADYPFTTLVPTLGVVDVFGGVREGGSSFVIADIPGLIPGASDGIGLGIEFLKHVERTRVLLHLVTLDHAPERDPLADYDAIRAELEKFSPELAVRPEVVVLSKADIPEVRDAHDELARRFAARGIPLRLASAATTEGIEPLVLELYRRVRGLDSPEDGEHGAKTAMLPPPPASEEADEDARPTLKPPAKKPAAKKAAPKKKVAAPKKKAAAPKKKAAAPKKKAAAPKKKAAAPNKNAAAKKAAPKKKVAPKKAAPKKKVAAKKVARKAAPKKKVAAKKAAKPKRATSKKQTPKKAAAPKKKVAAPKKKTASRKKPGRR
ncbi:MAG: GTPase ObgE [Polyangiaceae bacterium]|nr:GTPase ObgE [Polyangiaceae bacterium]